MHYTAYSDLSGQINSKAVHACHKKHLTIRQFGVPSVPAWIEIAGEVIQLSMAHLCFQLERATLKED